MKPDLQTEIVAELESAGLALEDMRSELAALTAENKRLRDALEYAASFFDEANLLRREVREMVPEAPHIADAIRSALNDSR